MATATVPLCQHWLEKGARCGSPAIRGTRYCYSHRFEQARDARKNAERARQRWFESAQMDDVPSVQRAIREVMTRLLTGNIDRKQAGQMLYKLQTVSVKLRRAEFWPGTLASDIGHNHTHIRSSNNGGETMPMSFANDQPSAAAEICIRQFQPGDAAAFRRLNEEWITRFFRIEPKEQPVLADPQTTILTPGGRIFMAATDERCVGCCALIRIRDKEFEVAKMAVEPAYQREGIGRRLLHAVIEEGRSTGARRLYLETNHALTPAIRLYESMGFKHIDAERIIPSRYARADVYMELILA
jgi:putative acetyltransferase